MRSAAAAAAVRTWKIKGEKRQQQTSQLAQHVGKLVAHKLPVRVVDEFAAKHGNNASLGRIVRALELVNLLAVVRSTHSGSDWLRGISEAPV